jgi:cell division protein FtsB
MRDEIEDRMFDSLLRRNESLKKEIEQLKQTIELLKKKAMQNAIDPRILDRAG